MKLIIAKINRPADVPYIGQECEHAGVTGGRTYLSLDHANLDLAKLNANAIKFEIIPKDYKVNGVWVCSARSNAKIIPDGWQKLIMDRWAIRDVRFYDRFMRFASSSNTAFGICKDYNSFIFISDLTTEGK